MHNNLFIITFFVVLNFFILFFFEKIDFFHRNIDTPDSKRKLHKKPVALAGGSILFLNLLFYFFLTLTNIIMIDKEIIFLNHTDLILFFITCLSIFTLGFIDDGLNLSASIKFIIITILIFLTLYLDSELNINSIKFSFLETSLSLDGFSMLFTCFCFLVFLNAFNMFDGINLQSCSYSIIMLLSILFFYIDTLLIKILILGLASYGYLNFKNKTFLGDSGSLLISFIIGYIFIKIYNFEIIQFSDEIVIFMLIPGLDLIRLFFKRIVLKRNPLSPDRFHLHHLLLLKFSYYKTLTIITSLILFPIFLNFLDFDKKYIILLTILVYSLLIKKIHK